MELYKGSGRTEERELRDGSLRRRIPGRSFGGLATALGPAALGVWSAGGPGRATDCLRVQWNGTGRSNKSPSGVGCLYICSVQFVNYRRGPFYLALHSSLILDTSATPT